MKNSTGHKSPQENTTFAPFLSNSCNFCNSLYVVSNALLLYNIIYF